MDASCPSLPPKILVADKVRPNEQTTVYMAAHGCHFVECFWYVLLVIIESFFLALREPMIARTLLYKVSIAIVSRSFLEKRSPLLRYSSTSRELPDIQRTLKSPGLTLVRFWNGKESNVIRHSSNNSSMVVIKVVTTLLVQA